MQASIVSFLNSLSPELRATKLWVLLQLFKVCRPYIVHSPDVDLRDVLHPAQSASVYTLSLSGTCYQSNWIVARGCARRYLPIRFNRSQHPFVGWLMLRASSFTLKARSGLSVAK